MPGQSAAIRHLAGIVGGWGLVLAIALTLQRVTILIMVNAGERVQFDIRRLLFAPASAPVDELLRQDEARADHQPVQHRREQPALRSTFGASISWSRTRSCSAWPPGCCSRPSRGFSRPVAWLAPILFVLNRTYRKAAAGVVPAGSRRFYPRLDQPGGEHYRRARGDRVQPAGMEPGRLQLAAVRQHGQQRHRRPGPTGSISRYSASWASPVGPSFCCTGDTSSRPVASTAGSAWGPS